MSVTGILSGDHLAFIKCSAGDFHGDTSLRMTVFFVPPESVSVCWCRNWFVIKYLISSFI